MLNKDFKYFDIVVFDFVIDGLKKCGVDFYQLSGIVYDLQYNFVFIIIQEECY